MDENILANILEELRTIRVLLELPASIREAYDKELADLSAEMRLAQSTAEAMPLEREEESEALLKAAKAEYYKQAQEILERRKNHFLG